MNFIKLVASAVVGSFILVACGENGRQVKVGNNPVNKQQETQKAAKATGLKPISEAELEPRILSQHLHHSNALFKKAILISGDEIAALDPEKCMGQSTNKLPAKDLDIALDIDLGRLEEFNLNFKKLLKAKQISVASDKEPKAESEKEEKENLKELDTEAGLTRKQSPADETESDDPVKERAKQAAKLAPELKLLTLFKYVAMQECEVTLTKSLEQSLEYTGLIGEFELNGVRYLYVESTPKQVDADYVLLQKYFNKGDRDSADATPVVLKADNGISPMVQDLMILSAPEKKLPTQR